MMGIIMLIASIFDFSEKMDDFLDRNAPFWGIIIDYYVNFIIFYGNLFSPLLIFISVIFFTSQMAARTEIVAILSSGISFKRMLLPYFLASTFLAIISLAFNHFVIPYANKTRIKFEENYFKLSFNNYDKNIHKQIGPTTFSYFEKYNADADIGYKFTLEEWENDLLIFKLQSDYAQFDSLSQSWVVYNYKKRYIDGETERLEVGAKMDTIINLHPSEFEERLEYTTQMMNTIELEDYIEKERQSGSENLIYHLIEKHSRTSIPFSTFVLVLIGVSISSRKVRGGIGAHLALGLFIAVLYIFAIKVTTVYATNAGLSPLLACWLPNFMFAGLALYIFNKAPK
ncbi:MAG: LptF/LptG family permease [Flavobacteriales bacterium]|nr:LptF/LptG family permease [Flavobacteriales bacterium]